MKNLIYFLPEDFDNNLIPKNFNTVRSDSSQKSINYYDTFDWRLFENGMAVTETDDRFELIYIAKNEKIQSFSVRYPGKIPEELKTQLKQIIDIRALIKLASFDCVQKNYRLLNNQQKTLVKFAYLNYQHDNKQKMPVLEIKSLRRYEKEFNNFKQSIEELNLHKADQTLFYLLMNYAGIVPGSYTSKINITLEHNMPAHAALRKILSKLFHNVTANEKGIVDDIDSEFLHDFRVAVRRTRSALSQIKKVFSAEEYQKAKENFRYLGKLTNNMRDLDVYILKEKEYKDLLPENLKNAINPFFGFLKEKRKKELKKLRRNLNSARYKRIKHEWLQFLDKEEAHGMNAEVPILNLARDTINKRYKRVIKDGKKVSADCDDSVLHQLRIDCKKLRYLIEFFSSLFAEENSRSLIKKLKKLQDVLGLNNDLSVQQKFLTDTAHYFNNNQKTLLAVGSLIGLLNQQQMKIRSEIHDKFAEFSSEHEQKLVDKLLDSGGEGSL